MNGIFNESYRIPKHIVIIIFLSLSVFYFGWQYSNGNNPEKLTNIYLGLTIGLGIAIIQFLFSWSDYQNNEKIKKLGIINVLPHREDREFYRKYITKSSENIGIMGVTAIRLLEHFADEDSLQDGNKVLIHAIIRHVNVKILICNPIYLEKSSDILNSRKAEDNLKLLSSRYQNFQYAYYDHVPTHSIFTVDDHCIIGPHFPGVASKDTPCFLLKKHGPYVRTYLKYFDDEWKKYHK